MEIPSPELLETGQKTLENEEQEGPPQGGEERTGTGDGPIPGETGTPLPAAHLPASHGDRGSLHGGERPGELK